MSTQDLTGLKVWDQIKTPPTSATKPVSHGRRFTAIDAQWQIQEMTRLFGPVGHGWGYEAKGWFIGDPGIIDTQPHYVVDVTVWTVSRACTYGPITAMHPLWEKVGGSFRLDSDAPKKAITDALTKALSHLGMAAEVYMGRFDDQAYVQSLREQEQLAAAQPARVVAEVRSGGAEMQTMSVAPQPRAPAANPWWQSASLTIPPQPTAEGNGTDWAGWVERLTRAAQSAPDSAALERLIDDNGAAYDRLGQESVDLFNKLTYALISAREKWSGA